MNGKFERDGSFGDRGNYLNEFVLIGEIWRRKIFCCILYLNWDGDMGFKIATWRDWE